MLTGAVLEALRDLEEGDILLRGAVGDTSLIASKILNCVLSGKSSEFIMDFLFLLEVLFDSRFNLFNEFFSSSVETSLHIFV